MKHVLLSICLALVGSAIISPAAATGTATQRYAGVIIGTEGPQQSALPIGATVLVTYTVIPGTFDGASEPNVGLYEGGLQSLVFQLPGLGYELVAENGTAVVVDNSVEGDDRDEVVFFFTGDSKVTADPLGGLPVLFANVFFTKFPDQPGVLPTLITSQALPLHPLEDATEVGMVMTTDAGHSTFKLRLESLQPTANEAISAATQRIADLISSGQMNPGVGNSLQVKLEAVLAAHEAGRNACGPLNGLRNQIEHMPRQNEAETAMAHELGALIEALLRALGGC